MRARWMMLALCLPAVASAMSADEYLAHCQTRTTYDQAACMGYLDALLERRLRATEVASLGSVAIAERDAYCLLDGARLQQIRNVVVLGLMRTPVAQRQIDARIAITDLLRRTYPASACEP
jgi:hypothetical protein